MQLIAPESYWQASPEEIAAKTNGCGPEGWRLAIVEMLGSCTGLDFTPACRIHDWMYGHGLAGDEEGRKEADITLKINIDIIVLTAGGPLTAARLAAADAFYVGVREGGAEHYGVQQ